MSKGDDGTRHCFELASAYSRYTSMPLHHGGANAQVVANKEISLKRGSIIQLLRFVKQN